PPSPPPHQPPFPTRRSSDLDRHDEAGVLRERNKLGRRNHAALGMLPAQQRLESDDRSGGEIHDRLVNEPQLVALNAATQIVLQLDRKSTRLNSSHGSISYAV